MVRIFGFCEKHCFNLNELFPTKSTLFFWPNRPSHHYTWRFNTSGSIFRRFLWIDMFLLLILIFHRLTRIPNILVSRIMIWVLLFCYRCVVLCRCPLSVFFTLCWQMTVSWPHKSSRSGGIQGMLVYYTCLYNLYFLQE